MIVGLCWSVGMAQSKEEKLVLEHVENWRKAVLGQDVKVLNRLFADEMTYGHSNGQMDTKASFISSIGSKKEVYNSLELSDFTINVVGNTALVRHVMVGNITMEDGSTMKPNLGVLQVWTKNRQGWQLLARQAYKR